jgi:hypothetical protein
MILSLGPGKRQFWTSRVSYLISLFEGMVVDDDLQKSWFISSALRFLEFFLF